MALTTEKQAVDTAWGTLETEVNDYIAAGGRPELVARWLLARIAGISNDISKAITRGGSATHHGRKALRSANFADVSE